MALDAERSLCCVVLRHDQRHNFKLHTLDLFSTMLGECTQFQALKFKRGNKIEDDHLLLETSKKKRDG